jgi:hypothetical protein
MTTMYELTKPVLMRGFSRLIHYLDHAALHAAEENFDPGILVRARLFPDMLPLAGQIQRASDNAKNGLARLAQVKAPPFPDDEVTIDQLKSRIAGTVAFLDLITPEQLEGSDQRPIDLSFRSVSGTMTGRTYALGVLLPNFWFHVATVHGILRHNGVKIGKKDFIGAFDPGQSL